MPKVVKALVIEFKADYGLAEKDGKTVLHCAISVHGVETAMFLLGLPDINVNTVANRTTTPLMLCSSFNTNDSLQIAQRLVDRGADLDYQGDKDYDGYR